MADTKITGLTNFDSSNTPYWPPAPASDVIPIVDVSDTTMAGSGTTKKISINNLLSSSPTATGALTVTGLVTAGSATITGDLTVDTSTLKVDSTNNRVGIGTAAPANTFQVIATTGIAADFAGTGAAGFQTIARIRTASANSNGFLIQGNNTTDEIFINNFYNGALLFGTNNVERYRIDNTGIATWSVAGTTAMTLDASGNLLVGVASANANGGVLQLKSGITFPATQVASSDANTLDDYEEGTFTATLKGGTTDPTIAVTTTGKYTKIGNQVFVRIMFGNVSTVGASGAISITGLPFTSATTPEQIGYLMVENMATFTNSSLSSYLGASSTTLSLYTSTSNSVITAITHNAGVAGYLWTAITYTAA